MNLYAYAQNRPLDAIDPRGTDVVVLNAPIGRVDLFDHQAVLIGNDQTGWEIHSLEGTQRFSNRARYAPHTRFPTLASAFGSQHLVRYNDAYRLPATPAQDAAMVTVANRFEAQNRTYNLINCNCGDLVWFTVSVVDAEFPATVNPASTEAYMLQQGYVHTDLRARRRDARRLQREREQQQSLRAASACLRAGISCGSGVDFWN